LKGTSCSGHPFLKDEYVYLQAYISSRWENAMETRGIPWLLRVCCLGSRLFSAPAFRQTERSSSPRSPRRTVRVGGPATCPRRTTVGSDSNRHTQWVISDTRLNLIHEIDKKLRAYSNCSQVRRNYWLILTDELVLQHSALRARPRVAQKDIASVSNWFYNHNNAIHPAETEYINSYEDLFSIVPKFKTPLRRLLETSSRFRLARLWRKAPKLPDENIHYSSDQRIEIFVNVINTTLRMIMLVVPLWILAFVDKTTYRLAIITTFLVFFLCFVSFTTSAKPFESLGATAA
jgi:hypothetical protein